MAALADIRSRLDAVLTVRSRHPGADPESERLLLTLADGQTIEEVLLPRRGVCVSTQMGCAVGCVFCMTGKGGLVRQLSDMGSSPAERTI
jgi:23S rRNA (adenine2503-C2)-methyltransferase